MFCPKIAHEKQVYLQQYYMYTGAKKMSLTTFSKKMFTVLKLLKTVLKLKCCLFTLLILSVVVDGIIKTQV